MLQLYFEILFYRAQHPLQPQFQEGLEFWVINVIIVSRMLNAVVVKAPHIPIVLRNLVSYVCLVRNEY